VIYRTFVPGTVRPQGSMKLFRNPRTGKEVASYSDSTMAWRNTLHLELRQWWDGRPPIETPVEVTLDTWFARPKGHFGTGRNAGQVRPSAPVWQGGYPDLDKCERAVGDGLVDAGVLLDDALIVSWIASKQWCEPGQKAGAAITLEVLDAHDDC